MSWIGIDQCKSTVSIEENPGIVGIFEMYFLRLHKTDPVAVGLDHSSLKSNSQANRIDTPNG